MVLPVETNLPPSFVAKHQQILNGAAQVFLEAGYEGASMSEIGKRAGVSKSTLYNHFEDKETLFAAIIETGSSQVQGQLYAALVSSHGSIQANLMALGQRLLEVWTSRESVAFLRMVEAETTKQPQLGSVVYDLGYKVATERMADYFSCATSKGLLAIPDVAVAAWQFIALCRAEIDAPMRLGLIKELTAEARRGLVERAVATFIRAYGPPG